jgi:UDP-glucose 4-epimerase
VQAARAQRTHAGRILGTGTGNSVAEVLAACRAHCNGAPASELAPRREGDPAVLVASNNAAATSLRWHPRRTLADCVTSALAWHKKAG